MTKIGIYPGTFDPITYGHIDVIKRSLKIVNKLIVAVSNDYNKDYLFSCDERVSIIKNSLFKDLKFKSQSVKVLPFNTLTTSLADEQKRWAATVSRLEKNKNLLPGNSIIAAGMISYSGSFTPAYRKDMEQEWRDHIDTTDIPYTSRGDIPSGPQPHIT